MGVIEARDVLPAPQPPANPLPRSLALLASLATAYTVPIPASASERPRSIEKFEEWVGGYVRRDDAGRRLGTIDPGPSGTMIERDTRGRRVGTWEPGPGGEWIVRDNRGRRVGTVERRP